MDSNQRSTSPISSQITDKRNRSLVNSKLHFREVVIEGSSVHESNSESMISSSPVGSSLGRHDSAKDLGGNFSSASSQCCSESVSEADEDDGCLDDWEAVADALITDENHKQEPATQFITNSGIAIPELLTKNPGVTMEKTGDTRRTQTNCRAWRHDDALRPRCLPNLSQEHILNMELEHLCGQRANAWRLQNILSQPSSCPICYEDLDATDSSFLPCPCGFRLCLFCHKRILEVDRRCPGCREKYEHMPKDVGFNGGVISSRISWF